MLTKFEIQEKKVLTSQSKKFRSNPKMEGKSRNKEEKIPRSLWTSTWVPHTPLHNEHRSFHMYTIILGFFRDRKITIVKTLSPTVKSVQSTHR